MSGGPACARCGSLHDGGSDLCAGALLRLGLRERLAAGTRLGPYEILGFIGAGSMGEVYRGRDVRLRREIAIKVLPRSFADDAERLARFETEAQAASALNHPNILAVYDVGSHEGATYMVTELLEGETLRARLANGPLPLPQALDHAAQIARGLAAAHARGIVHRDLKPENVFVTAEGGVKILDFGLAVIRPAGGTREGIEASTDPVAAGALDASDVLRTEPGTVMGTLGYMSPEQARGEPADARSDVFSFGVVLYETLTGRRAFQRGTAAATIAAIRNEEPPDASSVRRDIPAAVRAVLSLCLRKDREDRTLGASEIATRLAATTARAGAASRRLAAVGVIALLVAAGGAFLTMRRGESRVAAEAPPRIAVLPFENLGGPEDDYFADGVADAVRGKLTGVARIAVIARASSTPYRKTAKTPAEIARELGVRYLLTATVRREKVDGGAGRIAVSPELVELAPSGAPISRWQQPFEAPLNDVFRVQAEIASRVARTLNAELGMGGERRLRQTPTGDMAAYDAFLQGETLWGSASSDAASLRKMLVFYEQAAEWDPGFAAAWSRISRASSRLYEFTIPTPELAARALAAAERAAAAGAPGAPEGELALGDYALYVADDPARALEHFEAARRGAPGDAELLRAAGSAEKTLGHWSAALDRFRQAVALDPRSPGSFDDLGGALMFLRRYSEAREAYRRGRALAPGKLDLIEDETATYLMLGDLEGARSVVRAASPVADPSTLYAFLSYAGDFVWVLDESQRDRLLGLTPAEFDDDPGVWALCIVQAHALRGDAARTREYAEKARQAFEEQVRASPDDAQRRACLGLALAYLGRKEEAIREGERAVALVPPSKDADGGPYLLHQLVRIYMLVGEREKALDRLERLLAMPSWMSPGLLRIDPNFDPLRGNPRFERLARGA